MGEVLLCGQIVRVIFFILNIFSGIISVCLIAVGGYVIHHRGDFSDGLVTALTAGGSILIIAGIIGVFIVAAGLLGAIFLKRFWLSIFIIALGFIISMEILGCILGAIYHGKITEEISSYALGNIDSYRPLGDPNYNEGVNFAVDQLQTDYMCCGWNSTSNWPNSPYYKTTGHYPSSCDCTNASKCKTVTVRNNQPQNIWNGTCHDEVVGFFRRNLAIVAAIGGLFGVLQIIPVVLACLLCCLIKPDEIKHTRL